MVCRRHLSLRKHKNTQRPTFVVVHGVFEGADNLLDKLSGADLSKPPPEPVVSTPPPVEAVAPAVTDVVTKAAPAVDAATPAAPVVDITASGTMPSSLDLPVDPLVAVGAILVVAAAATLLGGGGGDDEAAPASAPAPESAPESAPEPAPEPAPESAPESAPTTVEPEVDLSIPYDAAAKLAYEKAENPGDYATFKAKYEADAVAEVKAKQEK